MFQGLGQEAQRMDCCLRTTMRVRPRPAVTRGLCNAQALQGAGRSRPGSPPTRSAAAAMMDIDETGLDRLLKVVRPLR